MPLSAAAEATAQLGQAVSDAVGAEAAAAAQVRGRPAAVGVVCA